MDPKGLLLAGAEPMSSLHPAEPTGSAASPPYNSVFTDAMPLLDRDAPSPSYGPAPLGSSASAKPGQTPDEEMQNMDHSSMNHGDMSHGTSSSSN